MYNIHPIFVHFPIALLFVYSVIKIIPFRTWMPRVAWKQIELALLICGVFGAFAALATGETARDLTHPNRQLVEMHSLFATTATWLYGLLLAGELLTLLTPMVIPRLGVPKLTAFFIFIQKLLTDRIFSIVLALLGLLTITVTGLLGGVMVYGTSADPMAAIVLRLLGISL